MQPLGEVETFKIGSRSSRREFCPAGVELKVKAVGDGILIVVACFAGEDLLFQPAVAGSRVPALVHVGEDVLGE